MLIKNKNKKNLNKQNKTEQANLGREHAQSAYLQYTHTEIFPALVLLGDFASKKPSLDVVT